MTLPPYDAPDATPIASAADLRRAEAEGVLAAGDAERLISWLHGERGAAPAPERRAGLNAVTVAYYFGAMLMIGACAWFLGDKWDELGSRGVLVTVLVYIAVAASTGLWLRRNDYLVGGGLLLTVAVSLVPLLTFTVEDMLGVWPGQYPDRYGAFEPWSNGSRVVMELATIGAGALALRYVRFAFLTAPIAVSSWFLSMDLTALLLRENDIGWETRKWIGVAVGLATMAVGYGLDRSAKRGTRSEDFGFWCYFFGLLSFWCSLTAMDSGSELGRAIYALVNVALVGLGVRLRRSAFLAFGALGVHVYLGHLAYEVFADSVLFPFSLALLGFSLILVTVWAQRRMHATLGVNASHGT